MLGKEDIERLLVELNRELVRAGVSTSIFICGGAVMSLVFNSRRTTEDIDGIFADPDIIHELSHKIAIRNGLPDTWINDNVRDILDGSHIDNRFRFDFSNLSVFYARTEYMLALKALACNRGRKKDFNDMGILVEHLEITKVSEFIDIVSMYFSTEWISDTAMEAIILSCGLS